uniref:Uncharacterized protein n=1 Tax=viral metagenome TaxID=1070528 RepID=A0A6C0ENI0_9ZZZZ
MDIFKDLYTNHKLPITIIIILIIYFIIYSRYIYKNTNNYIVQNWYSLKNNPTASPLSSLIHKDKGYISSILHHFIQYFTKLFKHFIGLFLKPFHYFINLIHKTLISIKSTLDKFRNMAQMIRDIFKVTVEKTADRINNSYSAILYLQEKIKLIIKKQTAMFTIFSQFALSLKFVLSSFTNGPIPRIVTFFKYYSSLMFTFIGFCLMCIVGGPFTKLIACPVCALCFDRNTPIHITETTTLPIYKLSLNNTIYKGGKITGIIKVLTNYTSIYNYNNVIVSGSHLVFYNNKWKRIETTGSPIAKPNSISSNILYCLITENNLIYSSGTTFSDYPETYNKEITRLNNNTVINYLNGTNIKPIKDDHLYYWGFSPETMLKIGNNMVAIKDVCIHNSIKGVLVIGLVELDGKDKILYNYNGIITTGSQCVYEKGIWIRVYQSIHSEKLDYKLDKLYHIITDTNIISINNILFRDFSETHDELPNNEINDRLLNYKNNNC